MARITRWLVLIVVALSFPTMAQAESYRNAYSVRSATNDTMVFAAPGTDVVYTEAVKVTGIDNGQDTGFMIKAESSGAVDLQIRAEGSFKPPANKTTSDPDYVETHKIVNQLTDQIWELATIDTVVLPYLRFKIIGQGSNSRGTVIQIKLMR